MKELKYYLIQYDIVSQLNKHLDLREYKYVMSCIEFISKLINEPNLNKSLYYLLEHLESKKLIKVEYKFQRIKEYTIEFEIYDKDNYNYYFFDICSNGDISILSGWISILEELETLKILQNEFK